MIPKEKIDEVKERVNIVQLISEYVPLKKRGHNHVGLCPFHSEKTPSFSVSEEKKIFYCFGCHANGSAITFLMKKEGLSFPDAIKTIAKKYGIVINETQKTIDSRDKILIANRVAYDYFAKELKSDIGKMAREYLEKRGFSGKDDFLAKFGVGFAPDKWDGLVNYLKGRKVSLDDAAEAGVIVKKEKGFRDRFRCRLIFPITDARGRIIGFGGRSLDGAQPKYLNSPESPVFKKSGTLYGLYQAKTRIMKEGSAIVVEGYFDLVTLHFYGFTNTVATMGTALTAEHLRTLKMYAERVYMLFDSDEPGKKAAIKTLPLFMEEEAPCRAILIPPKTDPDEFLRNNGAEAMDEAIKNAPTLMEFFLREITRKYDLKTPEGKKAYLDEAMPFLEKIRNIAEQGHYAGFMSSLLGVPVDIIYSKLRKKGPVAAKAASLDSTGPKLKELTIFKIILSHPELYNGNVASALETFSDTALKQAALVYARELEKNRVLNIPDLLDEIKDEAAKEALSGLLLKEDPGFIEKPEKMLEDSLKSLLNRGKLKPATLETIKKLEATGLKNVASEIKKRAEKAPGK